MGVHRKTSAKEEAAAETSIFQVTRILPKRVLLCNTVKL